MEVALIVVVSRYSDVVDGAVHSRDQIGEPAIAVPNLAGPGLCLCYCSELSGLVLMPVDGCLLLGGVVSRENLPTAD